MTTPPSDYTPSTDFLKVFPKVALPMVLALSDQSIVATALPAIGASLGGAQQLSLVVIGYLIAATIAAPVYGRFGDLYGRRRLLVYALLIFMSASVFCAFAQNIWMLVAGRVLQGIGGGGLMALSQALIGESVAPRDRARYQGYLAGVGVTSNALGPVLGGALTEIFGWRAIFVYSLPLAILALHLIRTLPKRTSVPEPFSFDYLGFVLFTVFVVSMLMFLDFVQRVDFANAPLMALLLAVALVSILLLIRVERRLTLPLLPLDLFRDPAIWRANVMAACHGAILVGLLTFVPIYLRITHGASPATIGLLLVPMTVGIGIGSITTGQIISRTGWTAIFPSIGMTVVALGLVVIAFLSPVMSPLQISIALGVLALFLGTVMSVVQVTVQAAAGVARIGAAAASVQYSRSMGAALGTATIAASLFATLALVDPQAAAFFGEALRSGEALSGSREAGGMAQSFATGFTSAFMAVSVFAAAIALTAWTLPLRRI
jgi:MFS family permease